MLKFRSKKQVLFPMFSILIWVLTLVAIIIASYYEQGSWLNQGFAIIPTKIVHDIGNGWWAVLRLISAIFLHGSWQHWAGNMVLFLIIALPLEKQVGSFWLVVIYFISGFVANILGIYQLVDSSHYLLGASGAVSGLLGAWILLFPNQKISIIIPIGLYFQKAKIPIILLAVIWLSIQITLQLISTDSNPIVWSAHIVGFITGFFIAWLYRIVV